MRDNLKLRRKLAFRAAEHQLIFVKKTMERRAHVLMKAFLWALYLPDYPTLRVERRIRDRYKPDLVAFDEDQSRDPAPLFWGEAGHVGAAKMKAILRRYPRTHFVFARWNTSLRPYQQMAERALKKTRRTAPIEFIQFPSDAEFRYIRPDGDITISMDDVNRIVMPPH